MNSLTNGNHTLKKFFLDSRDAFFGRTIEDILSNNFFDSFDANIRDAQNTYRVEIAVPGMSRKNVTIRVDGRVMWVSGQRQQERGSWRATEFSSTNLQRSFALPVDADTNKIIAKCRNGLLTIEIGKMKSKGTHRLIEIQGAESSSPTPDIITSWWNRLVSKAQRLLTRRSS